MYNTLDKMRLEARDIIARANRIPISQADRDESIRLIKIQLEAFGVKYRTLEAEREILLTEMNLVTQGLFYLEQQLHALTKRLRHLELGHAVKEPLGL